MSITLLIIMQCANSEVAFVISWWSAVQLINHGCRPRIFEVHGLTVFDADALARGRKDHQLHGIVIGINNTDSLPYKTIVDAIGIANHKR